jgi:hypothetical protein
MIQEKIKNQLIDQRILKKNLKKKFRKVNCPTMEVREKENH